MKECLHTLRVEHAETLVSNSNLAEEALESLRLQHKQSLEKLTADGDGHMLTISNLREEVRVLVLSDQCCSYLHP